MRLIDADELHRAKFHGVGEIFPPDEQNVESYKQGWNDALDAVADESCTPNIEPHKWIPCSERLPETDMCRTLTTICTPYKGTNVRSGCFYRGLFMNDNGDTWNATDKEVLAWMPLPEQWRGEEEDGNQTK